MRDSLQTLNQISETSAISSIQSEENLSQRVQKPTLNEELNIAERCGFAQRWLAWGFEISVLACIDRMLTDAMSSSTRHVDCLINSPGLADILVGSIHTSINGAYVYPKYAFAHELLGAGAWLGTLLRGRAALMPDFVAEVILGYLDQTARLQPSEWDPVKSLFEWHAGLVGGAPLLLRQARRVRRSGYPQLVKPGRPKRGSKLQCSWNPELEPVIRDLLR